LHPVLGAGRRAPEFVSLRGYHPPPEWAEGPRAISGFRGPRGFRERVMGTVKLSDLPMHIEGGGR